MVLRDELLVATNFTGDDEEAKYDNTDKWKHTSTNNSEITGAELITGVEITGVKIKGVKITEVEVKGVEPPTESTRMMDDIWITGVESPTETKRL